MLYEVITFPVCCLQPGVTRRGAAGSALLLGGGFGALVAAFFVEGEIEGIGRGGDGDLGGREA